MIRFAFAVLTAALMIYQPDVHAQSECADPFAGGSLQFSREYWDLTDFCLHSVPYSEIRSGGVAPDGIPPIDDPMFEPVTLASEWLQPQSPVIAVVIEGEARAYPLAILIWHEIVNDTIAEIPLIVTYCPLCNSAIVFNRSVNGETLRFGVSGNLRNSDLIMWDSATQSWWQQFTGEAIVGAYTGTLLDVIPSQLVSFAAFSEAFPDGQVLSRETGAARAYGRNPYTGYDATLDPFLFAGEIDPRMPATAYVLAGVIGDTPIAYPFTTVAARGIINDTVDGRDLVVFWQSGMVSALDAAQIDESRDLGMAAMYSRVLGDQTLTFSVDASGAIRDDQTASLWNVFGAAVEGELAGSQLRLMFAAPHLWFAWAAFQPETLVYEG